MAELDKIIGTYALDVVRSEDIDWIELTAGNFIKPLSIASDGSYALLGKMMEGSTEPRHRHVGSLNIFVVSGAGTNINGVTAEAGSWIYERDGAIHDEFTCTEETIALTVGRGGGVEVLDDDDNVLAAYDMSAILPLLPDDVRALVQRD